MFACILIAQKCFEEFEDETEFMNTLLNYDYYNEVEKVIILLLFSAFFFRFHFIIYFENMSSQSNKIIYRTEV